jgi:hypothetical protein
LRTRKSLLGGAAVPGHRLRHILLHPVTQLIPQGQIGLRAGIPLLGQRAKRREIGRRWGWWCGGVCDLSYGERRVAKGLKRLNLGPGKDRKRGACLRVGCGKPFQHGLVVAFDDGLPDRHRAGAGIGRNNRRRCRGLRYGDSTRSGRDKGERAVQLVIDRRKLIKADGPAQAAHLGPDFQHHVAQGKPRFGQAGRKHACEHGVRIGIVARKAVKRALPGSGREQDERPLRRRLIAQPACPPQRTRALALERIVPTCIEDEKTEPNAPGIELGDDVAHRYRLPADDQLLPRTHKRNVGGQQVVPTVDLNPVPGEEKRNLITRVQPGCEGRER